MAPSKLPYEVAQGHARAYNSIMNCLYFAIRLASKTDGRMIALAGWLSFMAIMVIVLVAAALWGGNRSSE